MFDEVQLTEVELTTEGKGTVIGSCHMVTRGGASGIPIDARFYFAWVLRDQRWAFTAAKLDRGETLAALRDWKSAAQSSQE